MIVRLHIVDSRRAKAPNFFIQMAKAWAVYASLFAPGILLDSSALQWTAAAVMFLLCAAIVTGYFGLAKTVPEAREYLDKLERDLAE